jgi:hypothetical protein
MAEENEIKTLNNNLNGNSNLFSNNTTTNNNGNNNSNIMERHYIEAPPMNRSGKFLDL